MRDIGTTLGVMVGAASVSKFDRDSRSYDIIPQVPQNYRLNPEELQKFFVRAADGTVVPLSSVVTIDTGPRRRRSSSSTSSTRRPSPPCRCRA